MPTDSFSINDTTIYVIGANGFIASRVVMLLLEKGYTVTGTVRSPDDPKNYHLRDFEGAKERYLFIELIFLIISLLKEAINGCDGIFHTASYGIIDLEQMVEPAMIGTKEVIMATTEVKVRRVVFKSSIGVVYKNEKHISKQNPPLSNFIFIW